MTKQTPERSLSTDESIDFSNPLAWIKSLLQGMVDAGLRFLILPIEIYIPFIFDI